MGTHKLFFDFVKQTLNYGHTRWYVFNLQSEMFRKEELSKFQKHFKEGGDQDFFPLSIYSVQIFNFNSHFQ